MLLNYFAAPGVHHDLLSKMNHKGITALKNDRRFRSRISGSRSHVVLPDGTLVDLNTKDKLAGPLEKEKTKRIVKKGTPVPSNEEKKSTRRYYVNEKIISARVYSYVTAMKVPVLHAITISFPPMVTEDQAFQYRNTWLTVCKKYLHLREHLVVAERQQNGTTHFHLLIPQYFNVIKANRAMSVILRNECRKNKLPGYSVFQAKKYNGVDIAKDRKTKKVTNFGEPKKRRNLVAYITKYLAKGKRPRAGEAEDDTMGFKHLAWHNSRGFSAMFTGVNITELEARFLGIRGMVNFTKMFSSDFFTWLPWATNNPPDILTQILRTVNRELIYNDSKTISKKLTYMTTKEGAPGWNDPIYRKYSSDGREHVQKYQRKAGRPKTDAEKIQAEIDLQKLREENSKLPTFDEWKRSLETKK
jgi:hypothetical protein